MVDRERLVVADRAILEGDLRTLEHTHSPTISGYAVAIDDHVDSSDIADSHCETTITAGESQAGHLEGSPTVDRQSRGGTVRLDGHRRRPGAQDIQALSVDAYGLGVGPSPNFDGIATVGGVDRGLDEGMVPSSTGIHYEGSRECGTRQYEQDWQESRADSTRGICGGHWVS